jgi:hypothetical protein
VGTGEQEKEDPYFQREGRKGSSCLKPSHTTARLRRKAKNREWVNPRCHQRLPYPVLKEKLYTSTSGRIEQRTARSQKRRGISFSKKVFPKGTVMKAWVNAEGITSLRIAPGGGLRIGPSGLEAIGAAFGLEAKSLERSGPRVTPQA